MSINARIRSEMAVPLEIRGQIVGLLNVDSKQVDAFSATDEERLVDMASEAAKWLELAWEIDQLRLKSRQLTSPGQTAQMIISENNVDEILEQITVQTSRLMKARVCSIFFAERRRLGTDPARLPRRRGAVIATSRICASKIRFWAAW